MTKRICRICGCVDERACVTSEGPCSWMEPDLCSACRCCISVRQPWAWLIVNGIKPIENRSRADGAAPAFGAYRGPLLIHAGKRMTPEDYEACRIFVGGISSVILPPAHELERGGIVGRVEMTGLVEESASPWFTGDWGLTFDKAIYLPFRPCSGMLGIFRTPKVTRNTDGHRVALADAYAAGHVLLTPRKENP